MDGRDRKGAMDSCGIDLCDFHLINVDRSNSALAIWLGSRYFSPTASGRARVTPASGPEARCSLLSTIRAAYTELHCLRTVCNHRRLVKLSDPNVNLSVLIWQFHLLLPSLSESRRPTIYYAMQYSTFLNPWSSVLGSCKSVPHSVTMQSSFTLPTVFLQYHFHWILVLIFAMLSAIFLFLVMKHLRRSDFRNECFLSLHGSRAFPLSERRPGISCPHGDWACSQDPSHFSMAEQRP